MEIVDKAPGVNDPEATKKLAEKWPNITRIKEAPADADEWANVPDKLKHLEE